jgi:two-component system response regulator FixJ
MPDYAREASDLSRQAIERRLPKIRGTIEHLTPREREVMMCIVLGRTAQETADELGIARNTVEVPRQHVLKAFGVRDAIALTREVTIAGH